MAEFYVYYRIDLDDQAAYEAQVSAMQARLNCSVGISGRQMKSCSDPAMRMEVYAGVSDADTFLAALEQAVARFEVDIFLAPGERRHVECFSE